MSRYHQAAEPLAVFLRRQKLRHFSFIDMSTKISVAETLKRTSRRLEAAGCPTPRLDAEVLLAHVLNKEKSWLYTHSEFQLNSHQFDTFSGVVARREAREPVAYITGHKEFFGLDFSVDPSVLIPRPETELLVETALELGATINNRLRLADIGTGSGCIAVTLANRLPKATLLVSDISRQALQVARRNATRHQVSNQIRFVLGDLLTPLAGAFEMIVSNPPYISRPEWESFDTMPEVKQYEPRLALDGGPEGLDVIGRLLAQAKEKLSANGTLLVEIGYKQGQKATDLARRYFPTAHVEVKKDLAGLDRLLVEQQ